LLIRLALAPSFHKSLKSQKAMNDLQPKLNEMREKHKDNKEAQAKAMMELYKEHKINPLSSCLPLLIQLPILIGLYQVFRIALNPSINIATRLNGLYHFVPRPDMISPYFFAFFEPFPAQYYFGRDSWFGAILAIKINDAKNRRARYDSKSNERANYLCAAGY